MHLHTRVKLLQGATIERIQFGGPVCALPPQAPRLVDHAKT